MDQQQLLIDADDTLWENNIYFERAVAQFMKYLGHSKLTQDEVRAVLNRIQRAHGYGSASFGECLELCYRELSERSVRNKDVAYLKQLGQNVLNSPYEVMDGVRETLDYLVDHHMLIMVTKGEMAEQQAKIRRSGIAHFFQHIVIVLEKDVATYRALVRRFKLVQETTWMIGNSPRSDVNPALAAGLNAILIPHPHTWVLEHEEVQPTGKGKWVTLKSFADLRGMF